MEFQFLDTMTPFTAVRFQGIHRRIDLKGIVGWKVKPRQLSTYQE